MRDLTLLDVYRDSSPEVLALYGWAGDGSCGIFLVPSPVDRAPMRVVASTDEAWDHVSVSRKNRCPNWQEMECVKRLFFREDETAMQLHVPPSLHVNFHPYCLHMWRPTDGREIPMPSALMVGPTAQTEDTTDAA